MDQRFGKAYKLCSQKAITELFERHQNVRQFPFLLHYATLDLPTSRKFQIVISAPKRIFRKAHDRNRIKRLTREAFRKNKFILEEFLNDRPEQLGLFLIYTGKEEFQYAMIEQKMARLMHKLIEELKLKES
ncbi:MAG: ribonuclease P protein component [Bacteroidetes bacterium]|nr:MAG: ribonuclease P protein component [Bacteroidota bacterium]